MTPPPLPDPALVERFREDVLRLTGSLPDKHKLALAVSGGPDSMAMLVLASAAFPGHVTAATVNHRLRPEGANEAIMVAQACASLGVEHSCLVIKLPPSAAGNLQQWAREKRYFLLKRWAVAHGATFLCTAHHAEDQAETFLMRAARASGLSGLAAVRARVDDAVPLRHQTHTEPTGGGDAIISVFQHPITLLRPLLHWRRRDLRAVAEAAAIPFVDDPSNSDPRFDRARFRGWLAQADWIDPVKVGRSAEYLAETVADLVAISHWLWTKRALPSGDFDAKFDVADLPRGVRRYIAWMAIKSVQRANGLPGEPGRTRSIEPLLDALEAGRGATHAGVQASARGSVWHFREAPPRRPR